MNALANDVLAHLARLVAFDTRNPPRDAAGVMALMSYVSSIVQVNGCAVERRDLGDGCLWLRARRGSGAPLVNIHIDTVPTDAQWTRDPFALHVSDVDVDGSGTAKVTGLGACDIKGALAAFLSACARTRGPLDLLLTSDEEAGSSRCVKTFCADHDVTGRAVLVAEPTECKAVVAHRGIGTCNGTFRGVGGHASDARALADSAVHEAVRWAARALAYAADHDVRFNLGLVEGGLKANMIAASATVRFGVRPMVDVGAAVDAVCALAADAGRVTWAPGYTAPALPAKQGDGERARALASSLGLEVGAPVDFFTEAALFSQAGAIAVVIGPGHIAQAHTADEHVSQAQLVTMAATYTRLLGGTT